LNVPVLIRSHRHQNLKDEYGQLKLTSSSDTWEQWLISDAGNGKLTIKSHRNQHMQDNGGRVQLSANTQEWEQWTISSAGNDKVTIKSHRNQYLQDHYGHVRLTSNADEWEHWSILAATPAPTSSPTPSPSLGGEDVVNVLGWNVEYQAFRSSRKVQLIADRVANMPGCPEADIAGLQECMDENALNDALNGRMTKVPAQTEYNCLFFRPSTIKYVSGAGRVDIPRDQYSRRYLSFAEYSKNGTNFWHFNTHWGHNGAWNHAKSAQVILNKWRALGYPPALITGDFNLHKGAHKHGGGYKELIQNGFKEVCTGLFSGMDITFASSAHWDKIQSSNGPRDSSIRNGWSNGKATEPSDHNAYVCSLKLRRS